MYGQALRNGQNAPARAGYLRQQRAQHPLLVRQHHGEHRLAPAADVYRFEYIVLVFIICAAGNADLLYGLADILHLSGFDEPPRLNDLFIIIRQYVLMDNEIVFQHVRTSVYLRYI